MTIEVEETSQTPQDLEIELTVEKDHIEIIVTEIMNARIVMGIPERGKFIHKYIYKK